MEIERIGSGLRMSQCVIAGGIAYLSGQVAPKPAAEVRDQTRQVLESVQKLLAAAGAQKESILSATIYLRTADHFAEMNEVWEEWLKDCAKPARTTVEARLASEDYLIEIQIIAAVVNPHRIR